MKVVVGTNIPRKEYEYKAGYPWAVSQPAKGYSCYQTWAKNWIL